MELRGLLFSSWRSGLHYSRYGVSTAALALCIQLKEDYELQVKLSVWVLQDAISAIRLGDCENVQEVGVEILWYRNDFNLCVDSDSLTGQGGTMRKSTHSLPAEMYT